MPEADASLCEMLSAHALISSLITCFLPFFRRRYVFISKSSLCVAACTPETRAWYAKFKHALRARSTDFETPGPVACEGYPEPSLGAANLRTCSAAAAQAWPGCLALTIEMP